MIQYYVQRLCRAHYSTGMVRIALIFTVFLLLLLGAVYVGYTTLFPNKPGATVKQG